MEGDRSELATTRRRQRVRRAAITRSNLRRGALARGKKAQRSGGSGKPASKSCRRESNGRRCRRRWRRATRDKLSLATTSGGSSASRLGHGKLRPRVQGSVAVWRGDAGRGETGASCHKREKGRSSRGQREDVCWTERKKHPWTERTPEREVDENGEPPTAGTFLGATSAANPAARRGPAPRAGAQNRNRNRNRREESQQQPVQQSP